MDQQTDLKGQRINVVGTLSECQKLTCGITAEGGFRLSIGSSERFDQMAARFAGRNVVVAATFTGKCVNDPRNDYISMCADRSETLADPRLLGLASSFRK